MVITKAPRGINPLAIHPVEKTATTTAIHPVEETAMTTTTPPGEETAMTTATPHMTGWEVLLQRRPTKLPSSIKESIILGSMFAETWEALTSADGIPNLGQVMGRFEEGIKKANDDRIFNGKKCNLPTGYGVFKRLGHYVISSPEGVAFKTLESAYTFIDNCERGMDLAEAVAHTKGLPTGWKAIKRDGTSVNTTTYWRWMYISPEKVEYLTLKGKGGALEALKKKAVIAVPATTTTAVVTTPDTATAATTVTTAADVTTPVTKSVIGIVTPDMLSSMTERFENQEKINKRLMEDNKRLSDCVSCISIKIRKLEERGYVSFEI